ncbi:MAG: aminoacyl-tRNA hydrolase [Thermoflexibacter sp.]|jgi:ribosome-associated protein|nr:aminoacyl-tRNA hydrolase [Thermoflexibacter sp.]
MDNIIKNRDFTEELDFQTARSGGAGGQHVNKTETKVELRFDIMKSALLTEEEKILFSQKASSYINTEGLLILSSQKTRSQHSNKEDVIKKFYQLLVKSLTPVKKRKPTRIPPQVKAERLKSKKVNAQKKANRKYSFDKDE